MSTALAGVAIKDDYKDVLQLGNTGTGVTSSDNNVCDGNGTATALTLSTTAVKSNGAYGFVIPYQAGMPGNPGGFRSYQSDGTTITSLMCVGSNVAILLNPTGNFTYVSFGHTQGVICGPRSTLYFVSDDESQDISAIRIDSSNNLYFGSSSSTAQAATDLYFQVPTGQKFRWTVNAVEKMTLNATGQLSLGQTSPNAASQFQGDSTTQGWLPPRMTTTQKNAISSPPEGLMIYDTSLHAPCVYNGTAWKTVTIS